MVYKSGRSGGRAQAACSRRYCLQDIIKSLSQKKCGQWMLLLALLALLLSATAQGSWVRVGACSTPGISEYVALSGSYAYVAVGSLGLQIIDISNPASPFIVGAYNTPDYANGLAVYGSYAYVADDTSGLQIIDVSNPSSPFLKGSYNTPYYAYGVALSDSYAYVADGGGLQIIDVNNPASPFLVGACNTPVFAMSVALSGSYAYVAGLGGLQIIDVNNPASPFIIGTYNTPGFSSGVALSGSYAYVANDNSGLKIIDVSNPSSPFLAGAYDTPGSAYCVALSGSYAYVADLWSLQIIDVSNPSSPFLVGAYNAPGEAWGVALSGSYAYVAYGSSGLQVLTEGATLRGRAWRDGNGDGLQYGGEIGEANVAVQLLDSSGSPIAGKSTTTGSDGSYAFPDLVPGDYYVQFTQPSAMAFSPKDQGADDSIDSDVNGQGRSDKISLDSGQSKSADAGLYQNSIVINEIYPNPVGSDNQAGTASWERVELKNVGTSAFNVGQWTIRDDDLSPILATIPAGTIIPAGGYLVVHIGGSSSGISNSKNELVHLDNFAGVEMDLVGPLSGKDKEGLSYSCIPDASENWNFWGEPTFGGDLSQSNLPGAPNMVEMDYGDAPDTFKTFRSSDGARHFVTGPHLGSSVDNEPDGQPSPGADGDGADEDGATFSDHIIIGQQSTFSVTASASGILQAWMDFNGDGDFSDAGEQIAAERALSAGAQTVSFSVPADAKAGYTFARLRFSSSTGLASYGPASDGEVEDYRVEIKYGLGDYVWVDEDVDGIQDAGEMGLEGVTVNLRDEADNIVASQTTDADGKYLFENPAAGGYYLEFLPPPGYSITAKDQGADNGLDSDVDPVTHRTGKVNVVSGSTDLSWDAGLNQLVSISGMKFHDKDANGEMGADEPPISGWEIQLKDESDNLLQTTTTSAEPGKEGTYEFVDLQPGTYRVYEAAKKGWVRTYPVEEYFTVTLTDMPSRGNMFGNNQLAISGMKFHDKDANGEMGADEPPISGWEIQLKDSSGNHLQTTTTSGEPGKEGTYEFVDLQPGTYRVYEAAKNGWVRTAPAGEYHTVTLTNMPSRDHLFGNNQLAISGMKFHDKNANGQKEDDEPPLSSWEIQLKDESDNLLQTVTTSSEAGKEGSYKFVELQPGTYRVYEVQQDGWVRTAPAEEYHTVTLTNMPSRGNMFGNVIASELSGMKFEDLNANGAKDSGEPGLSGWTIKLMKEGTMVESQVTAADGTYSFSSIVPGSYTVEEAAQSGWTQSYPAGNIYSAVSSSGQIKITKADLSEVSATEVDFGNFRTTGFSGMKFEDLNGNGAKDAGEPGVSGWTIKLMKEGTTVASRVTAADGSYSFTGIAPGSYTVEEAAQSGWTQSYPSTSDSYPVTLVSGVSGPTNLDFGNFRTTGFSGMKFDDRNGNGAKDSGEPGLAGWTIRLMKEGTEAASTVTAADGTYSFVGIEPGSYTVEEVAQVGWAQSYPASGTHPLNLVSGVPGPTNLDFGNYWSTVLSGMKFEDMNGNGLKESDEPGLAGWTIRLMKEGAEVDSTVTAADGSYSFKGVVPGSYTVEEVAQAGWTQTCQQHPEPMQ
ncbi:MAG: Cna protein B-type domain protein [Methanosaeta sp. PtaU1.Bin112]|nr:MAG: Cna protein B-type domain protein [Methanosaeta sp. PtaU1.Bin112]